MKQPQLTIQFSEDRATQIYLKRVENKNRAESNCHKLLAFWQQNNLHLDKYYAKDTLGIDCLAQRVKNLRDAGVFIRDEIRRDIGEHFSRYWLGCGCELGMCYLHDSKLKV